jgi:hypothetical protein
VEACRSQEMAKEEICCLCDAAANATRCLVVSERECRERFWEPSLLQARCSELCLTFVGPPWMRNRLLGGCGQLLSTILRWPEKACRTLGGDCHGVSAWVLTWRDLSGGSCG